MAAFAVYSATREERRRAAALVNANEQAWAGSTANTYVAKYVLEHFPRLQGQDTQIAEIRSTSARGGKTDALLEDWQHVDQYKQYRHEAAHGAGCWRGRTESRTSSGPSRLPAEAAPGVKTGRAEGKESLFKSESGSQGMFLGGDPSYVQKDQQLIKALGLNFKFVSVGG